MTFAILHYIRMIWSPPWCRKVSISNTQTNSLLKGKTQKYKHCLYTYMHTLVKGIWALLVTNYWILSCYLSFLCFSFYLL